MSRPPEFKGTRSGQLIARLNSALIEIKSARTPDECVAVGTTVLEQLDGVIAAAVQEKRLGEGDKVTAAMARLRAVVDGAREKKAPAKAEETAAGEELSEAEVAYISGLLASMTSTFNSLPSKGQVD